MFRKHKQEDDKSKKVVAFLIAEWERGTEREKLLDAEYIKKVIEWVEKRPVKWDYEWAQK